MSQLQELHLQDNKIERIESGTFDDLVNILEIWLNYNKIKFMTGTTFTVNPKLTTLDLRGNVCFDGYAQGIQEVQNFSRYITAQCALGQTFGETVGPRYLLEDSCGRVTYTKGFVIGGNKTVRSQWPFLVALILASNGKYFCGGNLISSKHVLTAAHCLHGKYQKNQLEAEDIALLVGRHDLNARFERGSEQRDVAEIIIHPNWKNYTQKYDSDLALLILDREVEFSDFIQPVCLTRDDDIGDHFDGTVVGWGKSESEAAHENIPRQVSIKAVTPDVCFEKDHSLGSIYSRTTFCAGGEGVGPCTGDSGGGFFVNFKGFWTLKGIISAGAITNVGLCDVGRFTLFTKLSDFSDWIKETVERS